MKLKKCKSCGHSKSIDLFYKHPRMSDGHLNYCKSCKRDEAQARRLEKMKDPEWVAKEAQRQREKTRKRYNLYPEKSAAHNACRVLREKNPDLDLHHWSYLDEHRLDVFALTKQDHHKIHCHMQYDQERKMYRACPHMTLIDTREKAAKFYSKILNRRVEP